MNDAEYFSILNVVVLQTPFQRIAQQMQDVLGDGGILKEVVHEGEGPPVPRDASVSSQYQRQRHVNVNVSCTISILSMFIHLTSV